MEPIKPVELGPMAGHLLSLASVVTMLLRVLTPEQTAQLRALLPKELDALADVPEAREMLERILKAGLTPPG